MLRATKYALVYILYFSTVVQTFSRIANKENDTSINIKVTIYKPTTDPCISFFKWWGGGGTCRIIFFV
jgi:hypothetical protein